MSELLAASDPADIERIVRHCGTATSSPSAVAARGRLSAPDGENLLTEQQAADALEVTLGRFRNYRSRWQLDPRDDADGLPMYAASDVERVRLKRAKSAKSAPRESRAQKQPTPEAELRDLERSGSEDWGHGRRTFAPLDARERAVIYQAWRDGTLGPSSPWRQTAPPDSYRAAFESLRHVEQDDELAYSEPVAA